MLRLRVISQLQVQSVTRSEGKLLCGGKDFRLLHLLILVCQLGQLFGLLQLLMVFLEVGQLSQGIRCAARGSCDRDNIARLEEGGTNGLCCSGGNRLELPHPVELDALACSLETFLLAVHK